MKKIILWTIIAVITLNMVLALGVRPAQTNLAYEENTVSKSSFRVINEAGGEIGIKLGVIGDIKDYISLDETEAVFSSSQKSFGFTVSIPEQLPPGKQIGYITIEEFNPSSESVSANLKVRHKVTINVPVSGKYIGGEVELEGRSLRINLENIGDSDVEKVDVKALVAGEDFSASIQGFSVGKKDEVVFKLEDINGVYDTNVKIEYDGLSSDYNEIFTIGKPSLTLVSYDGEYKYDDINKLTAKISTDWNEPLENVFLKLKVGDKTFDSESFTLNKEKTVDLFFAYPIEGEVNGVMEIHYGGDITLEDVVLRKNIEEVNNSKLIIILLLIIAIIVVIFWLLITIKNNPRKVDPSLVKYIQKHLKKGVSGRKVFGHLVKSGWSKKEVSLAFKEIRR